MRIELALRRPPSSFAFWPQSPTPSRRTSNNKCKVSCGDQSISLRYLMLLPTCGGMPGTSSGIIIRIDGFSSARLAAKPCEYIAGLNVVPWNGVIGGSGARQCRW